MKFALCAVAGVSAFSAIASADFVQIAGNPAASAEGLGDFDGSIEYTFDALTGGELTITLTNTSPAANGGFLTGFVFNINSVDGGAHAMLTDDGAFNGFDDTGVESAPPFGTYDAGAALNGNWSGGGSPAGGIGIMQTGVFTFDVMAADASTLTALSFITGPLDYNFVVRFRGFKDGGSDKVPGQVVPAPGAMALLSLAGLAGVSRRRSVR
jgi:MYXO-CTERM domain-containing protein